MMPTCMHVPKDERSKFDTKVKIMICIFLGYPSDSKGYRFYDPECNKVVNSRDVKFNEGETDDEVLPSGGETISETTREQYVTFDSLDGDSDVESTPQNAPEQPDEPVRVEQPLRRSVRVRNLPQYYGMEEANVSTSNEPKMFAEAVRSPQKAKWIQAMEERRWNLSIPMMYGIW